MSFSLENEPQIVRGAIDHAESQKDASIRGCLEQ
jgi:hypothetical protein